MAKPRQRRVKPRTRRQEPPEPMATENAGASNDPHGASGRSCDGDNSMDADAVASPARKQNSRDEPFNEEPEGTEEQLPNDVVFQCASCRSVVGDTLSDYESHLESKTISLKAARCIEIEDKMKMSNSGLDAGCTYKPIKCGECRQHLGRVYGSTTPALDSRRCTYTFDTTALVSYHLGSCLTIEGEPAETNNQDRIANAPTSQAMRPQASKSSVSTEAFDVLHAHVESLTDATNKLSSAFDENCTTILQVKELADESNSALAELKSGLEHAQNMMLLWEERFRRLEACEQQVEQLTAVGQRMNSYEGRVARIEAALGGFSSPSGQPTIHRTPRLKVSPSIRRPTASPARAAMRAAVSPGRAAMRGGPSPARAPMRRTDSSPAVTPSSQLPKRRR